MDISLKIGAFGYLFRFFYDRFLASGSDISSLMKGYRTEVAAAETAAVMGNRLPDLQNCRNAAVLFIHRVITAGKRQVVNLVELSSVERFGGRVLL